MIGVIADPSEHDVVREFFELFKTPWEFAQSGQCYDVVLCSGEVHFTGDARLLIVYAARQLSFDREQTIEVSAQPRTACMLSQERVQLPVYGNLVTFPGKNGGVLTTNDSNECVAHLDKSAKTVVARIGYDLFSEVRNLLTIGQPVENAHVPTLELHISLLRQLILQCGIELVEIPPVPEGYSFIVCLTHDVDHPSLRIHGWDHTILGFLYRAVLGSFLNLLRGRTPVRVVLKNWLAALKLPLVQIGLAKDFWGDFCERYLQIETGLRSSFFVIPFKNYPGRSVAGAAPKIRAARYGASDIASTIRELRAADREVGLHGIDAWCDSSAARRELSEVRQVSDQLQTGVRMHWLYFDEQSHARLEEAGAEYDSSVGYNGTVGYRAGTTQVYKPLSVKRLLELPLHAMDTALFYPSHLGLTSQEAVARLSVLIENAARYGGCITINWHDRSTAPERNWGDSYCELIELLKNRGAWFATASDAVAWFRMRREFGFDADLNLVSSTQTKTQESRDCILPALRLRRCNDRQLKDVSALSGMARYVR